MDKEVAKLRALIEETKVALAEYPTYSFDDSLGYMDETPDEYWEAKELQEELYWLEKRLKELEKA